MNNNWKDTDIRIDERPEPNHVCKDCKKLATLVAVLAYKSAWSDGFGMVLREIEALGLIDFEDFQGSNFDSLGELPGNYYNSKWRRLTR